MIMMDKDSVRKNLEEMFDIPFSVQMLYENNEPVFMIGPEDPGKELFTVRIYIRNQIRLMMEFVPQKYSVNFIHSMGERAEADRETFASYWKLMKMRGARTTIKVNGREIDVTNVNSWPEDWSVFEARITKMPIVEDGVPDYEAAVIEWGSLMIGMILALADIVPIETEPALEGYSEGEVKRAEVNRYERNPLNRKLCVAANGYGCSICGFDFQKVYGELGNQFIHIHHITPVSRIGPGYIIDPIKDLTPVCPNCHAMLHRIDPPLQPEQLKMILMARSGKTFFPDFAQQYKVAEDVKYNADDQFPH